MTFSRRQAIFINFILNNLLPPMVRDARWFIYPLLKMAFKHRAGIFFDFREKAMKMSEAEFAQAYADTHEVALCAGTDMNQECIRRITREISGASILEVGCGRGFLLKHLLQQGHTKLTATDIYPALELISDKEVRFVQASSEALPFMDGEFETTICAHVLEHVRDLPKAVAELRRVTSKRLIIVLPKERPYKCGFNLHLSFFPYRYSVLNSLAVHAQTSDILCDNEGGDWYYQETL